MIWVSFFRPVGIFEGSFNKLAAWWTAGEYCHCELVWHIEPIILMGCVKRLYTKIRNSEEDHSKIAAELESVFFQNKDNKALLQLGKKVYVSFSLLWGDQLRIRFLMNIEDPWFSTPNQKFEDIVWRKCEDINPEKEKETLEWALSQVTKQYNSSAALFSWVPTWGVNDVKPRPSYFCSEFAALCLVRMGFLKPLATHHCTPNHLEAIIRLAEAYTEESVQEKKQSTGPLGLTSLSHDDNTPKRSNIQLLEDEVEPSRLPNYVSSSDDDISTLEEEMNTHLTLTQPKQEEELLSS
jgi:hypothetical protein